MKEIVHCDFKVKQWGTNVRSNDWEELPILLELLIIHIIGTHTYKATDRKKWRYCLLYVRNVNQILP